MNQKLLRAAPFLLVIAIAFAEETATPDQLDFWIGEWTVSWQDDEGKTYSGSNTVTRILDGKVIHESFDASEALGFTGTSNSVLDRISGKWKQTWVDSDGSYMDFTGRSEGDTFMFERSFTNPEGEYRENRMVFKDIKKDSLVWDWEGRRSPDGEWKLLWRLNYNRK